MSLTVQHVADDPPSARCVQVRGDSHGGSGPAADGLPLSEHQTLRGEFPAHGGQAAGVQRAGPAGSGDQLGKTENNGTVYIY